MSDEALARRAKMDALLHKLLVAEDYAFVYQNEVGPRGRGAQLSNERSCPGIMQLESNRLVEKRRIDEHFMEVWLTPLGLQEARERAALRAPKGQ